MKALLGTRKGLIILKQSGANWAVERTHFDGVKVSYASYDPVHKAIWAGVSHGHWGPKLHVSRDKGKSFQELGLPSFGEGAVGIDGKPEAVKDFWSVATDSTGRVWLGTEPAALFYSDDKGKSWSLCKGLHGVHSRDKWVSGGTDGSCVHSVLIDPKNESHIVIGISVAGCLESRDRGKTWKYINKGLSAEFLPDPNAEVGQDPHCVEMAPSSPNVLWQQNHCGIYKSENHGTMWANLSKAKGLKSAFGWAVVVDEKDPNVAYTIPAESDIKRVPVKKQLLVQKTSNGGKSWTTLSKGLPAKNCYDIVYRHAFAKSGKHLVFGSTTGNVFFSGNSGTSWKTMSTNMPPIYSVKLMA